MNLNKKLRLKDIHYENHNGIVTLKVEMNDVESTNHCVHAFKEMTYKVSNINENKFQLTNMTVKEYLNKPVMMMLDQDGLQIDFYPDEPRIMTESINGY